MQKTTVAWDNLKNSEMHSYYMGEFDHHVPNDLPKILAK